MVAAVERKSLADLASSLLSGKLTYALAELAALPRAAVVVEDRYSALFKLEHVVPGRVAEALAEAQARFPAVPVFFAEARPLAQEWTYRFLGAALVEVAGAGVRFTPDPSLSPSEAPPLARTPTAAAGPADQGGPSSAAVRAWAVENGIDVASKGRISAHVVRAYTAAMKGA